MSKYALLIILNAPFIVYGVVKTVIYFWEGLYNKAQLSIRLAFWAICLAVLLLAQPIYNFLLMNKLSTSPPLSIADVLLTSMAFFSLSLIIRLYNRLERAERKITELNERLALKTKL